MKVKFFVPGPPQGKARPRVVRRKDGRSMTYTPDKTVKYEGLVQREYIAQSGGYGFDPDAPLSVLITAVFSGTEKRKQETKGRNAFRNHFPNEKAGFG